MRARQPSLLVVWAAVLAASGCADSNPSLIVEGNILPEVQESGCIVDPGGTLMVPNGTFDVMDIFRTRGTEREVIPRGYTVYPRYTNQLMPGRNPVGADPNGILVSSVIVTLYDQGYRPLDLGGLANPFTVTTSTYIAPRSQSAGAVVGIPDEYRRAMQGSDIAGTTVVIGIEPIARTMGGTDVKVNEWYWPVDICEGCLFYCVGDGGSGEAAAVCDPGQDVPTPIQCVDPGM